MKKTVLNYLFLLMLLVGTVSCEKERDMLPSVTGIERTKIELFKEQLLLMGKPYSKAKQQGFSELITSLNWDQAREDINAEGRSTITVPSTMGAAYKREGKSGLRNLLLEVEGSTIRHAYVVDVITTENLQASNQEEQLRWTKEDTRQKRLFSGEKLLFDLGLSLQERKYYKEGQLVQKDELIAGGNGNNAIQSEGSGDKQVHSCIDWYLVTTYYYSDGSTRTTSEYLYTTCRSPDSEYCMAVPKRDQEGVQSLEISVQCGGGDGGYEPKPSDKICQNTFNIFT